jgi:hypothetical protein
VYRSLNGGSVSKVRITGYRDLISGELPLGRKLLELPKNAHAATWRERMQHTLDSDVLNTNSYIDTNTRIIFYENTTHICEINCTLYRIHNLWL